MRYRTVKHGKNDNEFTVGVKCHIVTVILTIPWKFVLTEFTNNT